MVQASDLLAHDHMRLKQCRYGPMLYPVTDMFIGRSLDLYGEYSWGEGILFEQLVEPGQTVIEAGAHIGAHTIQLGKLVGATGRVFAFEPQRVLFEILRNNLLLNALTNVQASVAAIGARPGTIVVPQLSLADERNFGAVSLGACEKGEHVTLETIDGLDLTACHLIKADVEGMESELLAGAEQTLRRFKPVLYIENNRRDIAGALINQLLNFDYRPFWDFPPLFNPQNFFAKSENYFGDIVSHNMLCLPPGDTRELQGFREIRTCGDVSW